LSKASILIVDDDEDILYFFRVLLEENGYKVSTAVTGREALSMAETNEYDLVLLDYKLTDIYGGVIADELKRMNERVQIIYITGYSLKNGEIPKSEVVSEVLVKPIPEHVLLKAVSDAVASQDVSVEQER
jgi:CheY-like chemotaxis protein